MIVFTNLTVEGLETHLYSPGQTKSDGGFLLFLLPRKDLPDSVTINQTWGPKAPAKGFYLFLNRIPPTDLLLKFDQLIMESLGGVTLESSSFAWVKVDKSANPSVLVRIATAPDADDAVIIRDNVTIPAPEPLSSIPLNAGAPVATLGMDEGITSFVFQYPPIPPIKGQPASGPPNQTGLTLPFTGTGRGCLRAQALYGGDLGNKQIVKNLFLISLDPLAPFDSKRTYTTITNESFRLIESDGVISIAPN
jgi:hypothetical protein